MSVGMGTARVPGRQGHFCRLREKGKNQTQVVRTDSPLPLKIAPPGYCRGTPWRALTNMTRGFPSARAGRRPMESPSPRRVPVSGAPYEVGRPSDKLSSRCEGNEGEMIENSGNKARMSMKTKDWSEEPRIGAPAGAAWLPLTSRRLSKVSQLAVPRRQLRCLTSKLGEQSQNVYENKGLD